MPQTVSLAKEYDKALSEAKRALLAGGTVVYPTDTLYGIGCDATSPSAVEKIYSLKRRDGRKPLSMLVSDYAMLLQYCEVSPLQERVLHALLPGPYTFILQLRKPLPVSEGMSVGVRVPEHIFMRQVSREIALPIVTTSANISGEPDAAELSGVNKIICGAADLVVDGGKCIYAQGSTVIDLVQMKVLRKGAVRDGDRMEF
jgi:tRNA threonylcarbamoyl adenosine modification protein (Sua5/YciO/YrdC/YwlC family)